jgi:hypothetical protein
MERNTRELIESPLNNTKGSRSIESWGVDGCKKAENGREDDEDVLYFPVIPDRFPAETRPETSTDLWLRLQSITTEK